MCVYVYVNVCCSNRIWIYIQLKHVLATGTYMVNGQISHNIRKGVQIPCGFRHFFQHSALNRFTSFWLVQWLWPVSLYNFTRPANGPIHG